MSFVDRDSISLARKQKRLRYWRSLLAKRFVDAGDLDLSAKLDVYALLVSKLAQAKTDKDRVSDESRLLGLERELASAFELSRLMPS